MKNTSLVSRRKELELKQWQIAERAGISVRYYQRLEAASSIPSVETAISIAKVLCSSVTDLFGTPQK